MKNIAVSLLTCDDFYYLKPCIESLLKSDIMKYQFKLFVFNNGANKEITDYLKTLPCRIDIIESKNNKGIVLPRIELYNRIKADKNIFYYLLELHPDMLFPKKWLTALLDIDDYMVGILEPFILIDNRTTKLMTIPELELRVLKEKKDGLVFSKCRQVHPWLLKMDCLDRIGYYDPKYSPQQCEDDDLVYRFIQNGFDIKSTRNSIVVHYGGVTRHNKIPCCSKEHKKYFSKKHGTTIEEFISFFNIHPTIGI